MEEETEERRHPIHILLVDDEAGFVDVLAKRLGRRQFRVVTACSGNEAVRALRGREFDIAVLDLKMEGMDGLDVLKIFKAMVPELPVIILTGHGCLSSAEEGIRMGAADYISKPYDFDMLVDKIRTLTEGE